MIVCLGWGSLVWNPDGLPLADEWCADGPTLPLEFARQSNGMRLTLVIDKQSPEQTVLWAPLAVSSLDAAIEQLRIREKCVSEKPIGRWPTNGSYEYEATIGQWAAARGIEGVVWTALGPKFGDRYIRPSLDDAISFLAALSGTERRGAEEYIRKAPQQIMTPYRRAFEEQLGWNSEIR